MTPEDHYIQAETLTFSATQSYLEGEHHLAAFNTAIAQVHATLATITGHQTDAERNLLNESMSWYRTARHDGALTDFDDSGPFGTLLFAIEAVATERGMQG